MLSHTRDALYYILYHLHLIAVYNVWLLLGLWYERLYWASSLKLYDACLLCSWMSSAECVSYMALLSYYINNSYNYSFYCRLTNGTQNQQIISSRATSFPCEENLNSLAMLLDTIKSPKHCWKRRIELHGGQHQQLYLSCFSNDHCKSWLDMIIINHFYDLNL